MKKTLWILQLFGYATVTLGGTLLHFLYDWTNGSVWVAPLSGVNESTFEHMKLLFWPMLIFTLLEAGFMRGHNGFICIKLRGILLGLSMIPIIFYTYNGVIGKSPDWINIAIFFVSAAIAFLYETKRLCNGDVQCKRPWVAILVLCITALLFVLFTFYPLPLGLFADPTKAAGL